MRVRPAWFTFRCSGAALALLGALGCPQAPHSESDVAAPVPLPNSQATQELRPSSPPSRPSPSPIVRISVHTLFFAPDSAALDLNARAILDGVAEEMQADLTPRLRVEGHTDEKTEKRHSKDLSEQRIQAVITYLGQQHGVPPERFERAAMGSARPFAPPEVPEGTTHNRRVEFWWEGRKENP